MSSLRYATTKLTADMEEGVNALEIASAKLTGQVQAVVAIAGMPDRSGNVLKAEELKALADGKTLFWDEAAKSLIYKGPAPRKLPHS